MKSLRTGGVLALLALGVTGANAEGAAGRGSIKDGPYEGVFSWTGFYVGAHLGSSRGDYSVKGGGVGAFDEGMPTFFPLDPRSFIGGLQIGYNYQTGMLLLGVEADVSFANDSDSRVIDQQAESFDRNFARARLGMHGTLTARVGLPSGQVMPYIKGGLAWTRLRVHAGDMDAADGSGQFVIDPEDETRASKTLVGWTIGGGLEYALSSTWSARAEYQFMDFRSFNTDNTDRDTFRHALDVHSIRFGVNYRLGN